MSTQSYVVFSLRNLRYGLETLLVKEIFSLPELVPVPETPSDIVGLLNLRGEFIPVMHLDKRLGQALQPFQLSDSVVVVEWQGLNVGMIVQAVQEVREIANTQVTTALDYGRVSDINTAFVAGVAQLEAETIVLLNAEALIRHPEAVMGLTWEAEEIVTASETPNLESSLGGESTTPGDDSSPQVPANFYQLYCPEATTEERSVFQQRAKNLRQTVQLTDAETELTPYAVVGFGGEYFGIDAGCVQEFTQIRNLTAIPCCPAHIVGNMNLRGEIVTLIDIRDTLNLAPSPVQVGSQTVVVKVDAVLAGLAVDEVREVVYLHPNTITGVPIAVPQTGQDYLKGTAAYDHGRLSVLDLPKLLTGDALVVNDAI